MKKKTVYIFLLVLVVASMVTNSCKKESQTQQVESLLTKGTWQLASVIVHSYIGSNELKPDTENSKCAQVFTFTPDHNCTYTNFSCIAPSAKGSWALTSDDLFINSTMTCTDTVPGSDSTKFFTNMPFAHAQIINLGQYSLVLQTGNIASYYTSTTKRIIIQYGFVHPTTH